jgi:3-hydroxyacyl-[acyl-carrier-protein] dehydratase
VRFHLLDRILEVQPGKIIKAEKNLTLGEEYLADHFPTFPVMPGVLMLESLIEAAGWLLRATEGFSGAAVVREVKNVKFGTFMEPGRKLLVTVDYLGRDGPVTVFKGRGECEDKMTVSAKLSLARLEVGLDPARRREEEQLTRYWQDLYAVLT